MLGASATDRCAVISVIHHNASTALSVGLEDGSSRDKNIQAENPKQKDKSLIRSLLTAHSWRALRGENQPSRKSEPRKSTIRAYTSVTEKGSGHQS